MIIDGKKVASSIVSEIKNSVEMLQGRKPHLAFILVGKQVGSQTYVQSKRKACASIGMISTLIELPESAEEFELLSSIHQLNLDPSIDGILVQLPLPAHMNARSIMTAIDPTKDVDGFHPLNVGKMLLGEEGGFLPCTPLGIKVLLEQSHIKIEGKHVVIIGRSNIVGKPLAAILVQNKTHCNATVTIAHSQSEQLSHLTRSADILVVAIGSPHFIKKEMVQAGAVVIDVGINRLDNGKLVGDVDFTEVVKVASSISPVPGGVGPMTIAMLMQNTFTSYTKRYQTKDEIQ